MLDSMDIGGASGGSRIKAQDSADQLQPAKNGEE